MRHMTIARLREGAATFCWSVLGFLAAYWTVNYLALRFDQSDREVLWLHVAVLIAALAMTFIASGAASREWSRALVRGCLAYMMLFYGSSKLLPGGQFSDPPLVEMDRPYYQLAPFWRAWGFFAYSATYNGFLAVAELAAGVLILFDRTRRLAACLLAGVLTNVVLVNYAFGINVLYISALLLVMAAALLIEDRRWLISSFWSHAPEAVSVATPSRVMRFVQITVLLAFGVQTAYVVAKYPPPKRSHLYGIWRVEKSAGVRLLPVGGKLYCDADDESHLWTGGGAAREVKLAVQSERHRVSIVAAPLEQFDGTYRLDGRRLMLIASDSRSWAELSRVY